MEAGLFSDDEEFMDVFTDFDGNESDFSEEESNVEEDKLVEPVGRRNLRFLEAYLRKRDDVWQCLPCCREFKSKQGCKNHLLNVHKVQESHKGVEDVSDVNTRKPTKARLNKVKKNDIYINMSSATKNIYDDVTYYFESFSKFLSKAKIDGADIWNEQWSKLTAQFPFEADKDIRMLTVGAGAGYRECLIIQHLLKRHSSIHITVVEPAQKPIDEFKVKAAKITKEFPGVSFEWHIQTFENYQKAHRVSDDERNGSFHLVFAGHSLYYMDDWKYALDGMYSHVQSGGMLVATIVRGQGSFGKLMKMYRKLEGCSQSLLTSDDLKSHLNRCSNVVFDQVVYREDPYDISDVFDESSNEGNLLLDFLVQRSGFRKCAPSDDQEKVLTFLKDNSVFENGKYWFRCDEEDVVAMK